MPATDLPLLVAAIRDAGDVARRFTGKTARRWDKPDGAGPVTEADLAVNDALASHLQPARPDYGWLSEETEDDARRLDREKLFIVDPIDGTRSFTEGSRTWAISLAVAEAGQITAAAIYLPLRDKLYAAARGQGAWLNDVPLKASDASQITGKRVLSAKPNLDARHWQDAPPRFDLHYRPSLAYRLALVGEGRYDGMLTLRKTWEWDIAAGALIVTEAGGHITDRSGAALRFNNAHPKFSGVIAGAPDLVEDALTLLRPLP